MALMKPTTPFQPSITTIPLSGFSIMPSVTCAQPGNGLARAERTFLSGNLFPKMQTLFLERNQLLEQMAGTSLAQRSGTAGSSSQPAPLFLEAGSTLPSPAAMSPAPTERPQLFAAAGSGSPSMGMHLGLNIGTTQRIELEPRDREAMRKAMAYWEEKPHIEMRFPLGAIFDALGMQDRDTRQNASRLLAQNNEFVAEFVMVSKSEIETLDPDERFGVLLGDCIFVSEEVPEDYRPMVVANLGLLRHLRGNDPIRQLLQDERIDVDETRHWSANMLDIMLAEKVFASDRPQFEAYVSWRKRIERTEFFHHPTIDTMLRERFALREFRRTTHPLDRNRWSRRSWELGGLLHFLGRRAVDENARSLGIAKCDVILRELCGHCNEVFDPEHMMQLIHFVGAHTKQRYVRSNSERYIDLREAGERSAFYQQQAHLLTSEVMSTVAIMESTEQPHIFILKPHYPRSAAALLNKIAFFLREGLIRSGATTKMLAFMKSASAAQQSAPHHPVGIQMGTKHQHAKLQIKIKEKQRAAERIQAALDKYVQLRVKYVDMKAVEYIPGPADEKYRELLKLLTKVESEITELQEALEALDEVDELLREQEAILREIVA